MMGSNFVQQRMNRQPHPKERIAATSMLVAIVAVLVGMVGITSASLHRRNEAGDNSGLFDPAPTMHNDTDRGTADERVDGNVDGMNSTTKTTTTTTTTATTTTTPTTPTTTPAATSPQWNTITAAQPTPAPDHRSLAGTVFVVTSGSCVGILLVIMVTTWCSHAYVS